MREYMVKSDKFSGGLLFGYDAEGVLRKYENQSEMSTEQLVYLSNHFPHSATDLPLIFSKSTITEVTDLSFERFWKLYDYKKGKLNAEKEWRKLNDTDKMSAIMAIPKYKRWLHGKTIDMVYPERFLKQRRFDDEY